MFVIGIDTGRNTGVAMWRVDKQRLVSVFSCNIIEAQSAVRTAEELGVVALIRIEDARLRKWIPPKAGREVLQGVGSVKRDASVWQDFCEFYGYKYELVAPKDNTTKLTAAEFARTTGWTAQTNEHARDAAMLVFGFTQRNLDRAMIHSFKNLSKKGVMPNAGE